MLFCRIFHLTLNSRDEYRHLLFFSFRNMQEGVIEWMKNIMSYLWKMMNE